jgi:hypothetical protein
MHIPVYARMPGFFLLEVRPAGNKSADTFIGEFRKALFL